MIPPSYLATLLPLYPLQVPQRPQWPSTCPKVSAAIFATYSTPQGPNFDTANSVVLENCLHQFGCHDASLPIFLHHFTIFHPCIRFHYWLSCGLSWREDSNQFLNSYH